MNEIKRRIIKNYAYAEWIKKLIRVQHNEEQKLLLIKYLLYYHSNNITGRYSDEWIEQQIISLADRHIKYEPHNILPKKGTVLHVMTKVAAIGGHTALVNNWIKFDNVRTYSIVFTDMSAEHVPLFLRETVHKSGGNIFYLHGSDDYKKAQELLKLSECFEKIVLNIHMYDIIPLMAYSNKRWNIPIYFYNHANFLFSIGVSIADCYLTLCDYDARKAKKYRGARNVQVLKMPQEIIMTDKTIKNISLDELRLYMGKKYNFNQNDKVILSMGDDFKFKTARGYDFIKFACELVEQLPVHAKFIIIGADPDKECWINAYELTKGKVHAIGCQPRDEVSRLMRCADVYVSSFPMISSGRQEANVYGIPSYTLKVTKRIVDMEQNLILCDTIKELKDNICEFLQSEKEYIHIDITEGEYNYHSQSWCRYLNEIFLHPLQHSRQLFSSKNLIGKEEYLNVQLLDQDKYIFTQYNELNIIVRKLIR